MSRLINTILNLQDRFSPVLNRVANGTRNFNSQLRAATASSKGMKKHLSQLTSGAAKFAKTSAKIGVGLAAIGGGLAIKGSIDTYKEFQQAMAQTAGTAGIKQTSEDYKRMEKAARDAGKATTKTAAESAEALGYMALAGWNTNDSINGLMPILKLSEATQADLAQTSDLVTDSMSALGVTVGENGKGLTGYLDILTKANNKSNQTATQLMEAYVGVGGTFNRLNTPLSESAALLGVMANRGIKGSEGGNSLSSTLINLTKKSGESAEAMQALGLNAYDVQGKFKGATNVLKELNDKTKDLTAEQRDNYLTMIGGKTQIATLNALMSGLNTTNAAGVSELEALQKGLQNAGGSLEEMAATVNNSLSGAFARLSSAVADMKIEMGSKLEPYLTPVINKLSEKLPAAATKLGNSLEKLFKTIVTFKKTINGDIFAVIGVQTLAKLTGISEKALTGLISKLKKAVTDVKNFFKVLSGFKTLLSGKISIMDETALKKQLTALTGMTTVELELLVMKIQKKIKSAVSAMTEIATAGMKSIGDAFRFLKNNADLILPVLLGVAGGFGAFMILPSIVKKVMLLSKGLLAFARAVRLTGSVWKVLVSLVSINPFTIAAVAIGALVGILVLAYQKSETFRNAVNNLLAQFLQFAAGLGSTVIAKLQELVSWFRDKIQPQLVALGLSLQGLWVNVLQPVASFMSTVFGAAFAAAFTFISGAITTAIKVIQGLIENLIGVFKGIIDFITGVFTDDWELAWTGVNDIFTSIFGGLVNITKGIVNGIVDCINGITAGVNSLAKNFSTIPGMSWAANVNITPIPHFALGTQYFKGGLAHINERGGEIVDLPNGSRIIPADKSEKLLKNNFPVATNVYNFNDSRNKMTDISETRFKSKAASTNININVYGGNNDSDEIAQKVYRKLKLALDNM